jgi:hypothetical protein
MTPEICGNVRLPLGAIEIRGTVQFFAVDVFPSNGGAPWRVMRRYNHFRDLASMLDSRNGPVRFPRKHWSDCEGSKLERRRQGLEIWLSRTIMSAQKNNQHWIPFLRSFLERSAYRAPKLKQQTLAPIPNTATPGQNMAEVPFPVLPGHGIEPLSLPAQETLGSSRKPLDQATGQAKQPCAGTNPLLHVPNWQTLVKTVQLNMPQLRKACMSAMTTSMEGSWRLMDMLD